GRSTTRKAQRDENRRDPICNFRSHKSTQPIQESPNANRGKNSVISGNAINNTAARSKIMMNGGVPRTIRQYGSRNTAIAVKISQPNGGVADPMATCSVTTTPTSTGLMPASTAIGWKIGVMIKITTIGSTNM